MENKNRNIMFKPRVAENQLKQIGNEKKKKREDNCETFGPGHHPISNL